MFRWLKNIVFIICFFLFQQANGQALKVVSESHTDDSSFYSILKITDTSFWLGGEYGILKNMDTNRILSNVDFPNEGNTIFKMEKFGNTVFFACANGVFYKYNLISKKVDKKYFKKFKNKSFYDFAILPNGKIALCGGNSIVAMGGKALPRGFVAETDTSLLQIKVLKNFPFSFVWSVCGGPKNEIYSAVYRPNVSKIGVSTVEKNWKKIKKIDGLIHELQYIDTLIYCGFISYKLRSGIFGDLSMPQRKICVEGIWSFIRYKKGFIFANNNGKMIWWDLEENFNMTCTISEKNYPIYDVEEVRPGYYLLVGHGKGIWTFNFR